VGVEVGPRIGVDEDGIVVGNMLGLTVFSSVGKTVGLEVKLSEGNSFDGALEVVLGSNDGKTVERLLVCGINKLGVVLAAKVLIKEGLELSSVIGSLDST
jgi:hypothetical protein